MTGPSRRTAVAEFGQRRRAHWPIGRKIGRFTGTRNNTASRHYLGEFTDRGNGGDGKGLVSGLVPTPPASVPGRATGKSQAGSETIGSGLSIG